MLSFFFSWILKNCIKVAEDLLLWDPILTFEFSLQGQLFPILLPTHLLPLWSEYMLTLCQRVANLFDISLLASVSVRFTSKEWGTRVKDHVKNGTSKRAGRGWGRKEGNASRQTPGFYKNRPLGLSCLSLCTEIWCCHNLLTNKMFRLPLPLLSFFCSRFFSCVAKTKNPVPWSFFAPKPNRNTCYAGYNFDMWQSAFKTGVSTALLSYRYHTKITNLMCEQIALSCVVFVSAQELSNRVGK